MIWTITQLTTGSDQQQFHSHSYYDIPVLNTEGNKLVAYRTIFEERQPSPSDSVDVGIIDLSTPGSWQTIGRTTAWSWQQGPMAQWVKGRNAVIWNSREGDGFVANLYDLDTETCSTLPRSIYAIAPNGQHGLSLDMGRLDTLRPGYGYALNNKPKKLTLLPKDVGVWKVNLDGSRDELILSLKDARNWLIRQFTLRTRLKHHLKRYAYWFNHAKISPDGKRFTVKLRWREVGGSWTDKQGVSLTADMDGKNLRYLANATSHVIWQTNDIAYFWRYEEVSVYKDTSPQGTYIGQIGDGIIKRNVHLRHLPPDSTNTPSEYIFDTPYVETVSLNILETKTETVQQIAEFTGHTPARGPYRCDLHPVPDSTGNKIIVTSLQDGGRQIYLLERS